MRGLRKRNWGSGEEGGEGSKCYRRGGGRERGHLTTAGLARAIIIQSLLSAWGSYIVHVHCTVNKGAILSQLLGTSQDHPGLVRASHDQPGLAKTNQDQLGPARTSQYQPRPAKTSQDQPGLDRTSQDQPGPAKTSQD